MELRDVVIQMLPDGMTEADIADVVMNHPTDPTLMYVLFKDSTYMSLEIKRPENA